MNNPETIGRADIDHLPTPAKATIISDELGRLLSAVRAISPANANVTFDFNGKLHLHIDVRNLEDVLRLEMSLPNLCGGIFADLRRGSVDNHPFLHRLSASVDR